MYQCCGNAHIHEMKMSRTDKNIEYQIAVDSKLPVYTQLGAFTQIYATRLQKNINNWALIHK